jgi:hypothetical protein
VSDHVCSGGQRDYVERLKQELTQAQARLEALEAELQEARSVAREIRYILKALDGVLTAPALHGIDDTYPWLLQEG